MSLLASAPAATQADPWSRFWLGLRSQRDIGWVRRVAASCGQSEAAAVALIEKGVADGSIVTKGNGIYRVYCLAEATVPLRSSRRRDSGEDEEDEETDSDDEEEDVSDEGAGQSEDDEGDGDGEEADGDAEEEPPARKRGRPRSASRPDDEVPDEDDLDGEEAEETEETEEGQPLETSVHAARKRGRPRSAKPAPDADAPPPARKRGRPRSTPRVEEEKASPPAPAPEKRHRSALQHLRERASPTPPDLPKTTVPTVSACIMDALQTATGPLSTGELVELVVKRRPTTRGSLKATIHWMRARKMIEKSHDGGYQLPGKAWPAGKPTVKSVAQAREQPTVPVPAPAAAILAEMYRAGVPTGRRTLINAIVDAYGIAELPLHRELVGLERSGLIVRVSANTFALAVPPKAAAHKRPIVSAAERVAKAETELAAAREELRALLDGKEPV